MVRIAIDGVQQMPGGASADFLQIVVERGDRHAAFGGGDLPIVMTDNRDIPVSYTHLTLPTTPYV